MTTGDRDAGHDLELDPPIPPHLGTPLRPPPEPTDDPHLDRGTVISAGVKSLGRWSWSLIGIMLATAAVFWLLGQLQFGLIPIMLAIILCTILYPLKRALVNVKVPHGLAAAIVLVAAVAIIVSLLASVAPGIVQQISAVVSAAGRGLQQLERWLAGPPLRIDNDQLQELTGQLTAWLQGQAANIASGFMTGVSTLSTVIVTSLLVLMLTFFFLKDGQRFLPAVRRFAGRSAGQHLSELLARIWNTLGAFIRTQALVGTIDALLIGLGLIILKVPLAFALMILTFLFSFIPTLGAIIAGTLAVLVALVSNGWVAALWVLVIVLAVQQIEGNVVFPILQSRSIDLHPAVSLVSVAIGATTFGIIGAFLSVPVVAATLVMLRYLSEQVDVISGERDPNDIRVATPDGALAAAATARLARLFRSRQHEPEPELPSSLPLPTTPKARARLSELAKRWRRKSPTEPE